ncbi:hypothetical protein DNTS_005946 [Danionella cerebrum]|uniref:Uncharacterized protein n=1 Tax=Danionella cerebrum TaxID=2873325 RepID=A0A553R3E2_9TELE|nr:hypothetical protein DNTS_005946 [Danionella translucida]
MGKLQSKFRRRSDLYRTKEGAEPVSVHQVVQYEPAHTGAINSVVSLTSDLCVSGGQDQLCCFKGSSLIFSASRDKTVLMWDLCRDTEPMQEFCGHELVVNGVAVSPDGLKLCTGSRDNSMRLWDIETGEYKTISRNWQVVNTFPAKQYIQTHCDVSSNCFNLLSSSNGFGGQGCEATLWDLRQPGCKVAEYRGHLQSTACCIFVPSRHGCPALVASSSYDSSVKIWDQNTAACLCTLTLDGSGPLASLAACDSRSILCASFNTGLHQLHLDQAAVTSLSEVALF